jgi:hypothetical protein
MSVSPAFVSQLKALKLGKMLDTLEVRLDQARHSQLGYLEFLQLLFQDEIERRKALGLKRRLQRASFEEPKTLEDFDFSCLPGLHPAAVRDLATGLFIEKREHVLLYGPAGVGKTHLAQALGHHACRMGKSVSFLKAAKFFRTLHAARADNSWEAEIRRFLAPDLLILDDFGLKPMTMTQAEDGAPSARLYRGHLQPAAGRLVAAVSRPRHGQLGAGPPGPQRAPLGAERRVLPQETTSPDPLVSVRTTRTHRGSN